MTKTIENLKAAFTGENTAYARKATNDDADAEEEHPHKHKE